jgi:hypothetical protein
VRVSVAPLFRLAMFEGWLAGEVMPGSSECVFHRGAGPPAVYLQAVAAALAARIRVTLAVDGDRGDTVYKAIMIF